MIYSYHEKFTRRDKAMSGPVDQEIRRLKSHYKPRACVVKMFFGLDERGAAQKKGRDSLELQKITSCSFIEILQWNAFLVRKIRLRCK